MTFGNFVSHPIQEILLVLLVQENRGPVDSSHPDVVRRTTPLIFFWPPLFTWNGAWLLFDPDACGDVRISRV